MKEMKEKALTGAKLAILLAGAIYCLAFPGEVRAAVSSSAGICLGVLIPSLYAMLIVSGLLIKSGALRSLSRLLTPFGRLFFGMDGEAFAVFLLSIFAGYPVGGRLLASLVREGRLRRREASLLSGVCFGAGPAFISGCIGARLYGDPRAGRIVLLSTLCADLLLALAISIPLRRAPRLPAEREPLRLSSGLLTDSIISGGRAMAEICAMVIAFAVLNSALVRSGALTAAGALLSRISGRGETVSGGLLSAILDVTAVTRLPEGDPTLLPWISALTAFGGLCVYLQIAASVRGEFPLLPMFFLRIAAAVLSYILCRTMLPDGLLMSTAVPAAAVPGAVTSAPSPVPSVLLILMTVTVLRERDKLTIKK